jgi:hypothetical protein
MRVVRGRAFAVFVLLLAGCAQKAAGPAGTPDTPVDPREPRAEVRARVDLAPAQDCEEALDLALYVRRAVELVAWDLGERGTPRHACASRVVTVTYLSKQMNQDEVLAALRKHAVRVTPLPKVSLQ